MKRVSVLLLVGASLLACDDDGNMSDRSRERLTAEVQELRAAAEAHDADAAAGQLAEIRAAVAHLREEGELSDASATRILDAASAVEQQLSPITTTTTTTTTTTAPPEGDGDGDGDGDDD